MSRFPETEFYRALISGAFPIVISLARHDMALARAARDAGADAIKLHLNAYHRASRTTFGSFAEERPFFEDVARLGLPLLVMAGQEVVPSEDEMEALAEIGVEGFNVYYKHLQPHLLRSRLRPMPAMADSSSDADLAEMGALDGVIIEASITPFAEYGTPLNEADLAAYADICSKVSAPVIAPSQKRFVPEDVARLAEAGIAAALLGVIVTGDTAESMVEAVAPMVEAARRLRAEKGLA
jgi:hypothetical protein